MSEVSDWKTIDIENVRIDNLTLSAPQGSYWQKVMGAVKRMFNKMGDPADLVTTDKSSVVAAVNEVAGGGDDKRWFSVDEPVFSETAGDPCVFTAEGFSLWRNAAILVNLLSSPEITSDFLNIKIWDGLNTFTIPLTNGKLNLIVATNACGVRRVLHCIASSAGDTVLQIAGEYIDTGHFESDAYKGGYIGHCYLPALAAAEITSELIAVRVNGPLNEVPFSAP